MQIILESADNGLIRTVLDANSDGTGKSSERRTIHQLATLDDSIQLLQLLSEDLGIFMGNINDKAKLVINKAYADNYQLSNSELKKETKRLTLELNKLKMKASNTLKLVTVNTENNE